MLGNRRTCLLDHVFQWMQKRTTMVRAPWITAATVARLRLFRPDTTTQAPKIQVAHHKYT
jgi:hypothetical protein